MLEIGLTGGIGSGKSTVAQQFVERGAVLIDADRIVRELQQPGQIVYAQMVAQFGDGIVGPGGALDRPAIAAIVFADADKLSALNGIVHPAVTGEMTARRQALSNTDTTVILDIPLLVESKYSNLGAVVVVDVEPELAVARLIEHRGFSESDARARIANQSTRAERFAVADFIIDNNATLAALDDEIGRCWSWITALPALNRTTTRWYPSAAAAASFGRKLPRKFAPVRCALRGAGRSPFPVEFYRPGRCFGPAPQRQRLNRG